jgi:hypothetical protein
MTMSELEVGDEVYMIDVILHRCQVTNVLGGMVTNVLGGMIGITPLDLFECDGTQHRAVAKKRDAIDLIIEKLNEIKEES